jgi:transcription elongation GreA/GreB family factor
MKSSAIIKQVIDKGLNQAERHGAAQVESEYRDKIKELTDRIKFLERQLRIQTEEAGHWFIKYMEGKN